MNISNPTSSEADLSSDSVDAIANLLMGGDAPDQTPPAPVQDQAEDPPTDETAQPEIEASDEEQADDSQDVDDEPASDDEEPESLAAMLGLSDDQLVVDDEGNISLVTKVNGKEGQATLADLIKGYQFESANQEKARTLAEERKAFEAAQKEERARLEQQQQYAEGLAMMFQQKLVGEYQQVNWEELRRLDPGEFAAKQEEFRQRQAELQQAGQYMAQYQQQQQQALEQESQKARIEKLKAEHAVMLENNPTWQDQEVFNREMGALREFVQRQYGYSEEDTRSVDEARLIELIKDAYAFRSGKSVAAKRNVPAPPKMQRAANGRFVKKQTKKQARYEKLVEAAKSAKGADKRNLQTDAIAALLMGEG